MPPFLGLILISSHNTVLYVTTGWSPSRDSFLWVSSTGPGQPHSHTPVVVRAVAGIVLLCYYHYTALIGGLNSEQ